MHTVDTIMKDIINLRIHIAPVGFEVDRIVIPAVEMKADKVWLIVHDNVAEDKAAKYREKVEKELEQKEIKTEIVYANRLRLFPIIKVVSEIILKNRKNEIFVNVASGSKIHAIGCMMACMMFDDREKIHPFYAQAEKYPEYDGTLQQTYGVAEIHPLPCIDSDNIALLCLLSHLLFLDAATCFFYYLHCFYQFRFWRSDSVCRKWMYLCHSICLL